MRFRFMFLFTGFLFSQSEDATLTIYKDGTALIKQPVAWSIPAGNSYVTWSSLPTGIHRDTPFLNLNGALIISQRFNDNIFTLPLEPILSGFEFLFHQCSDIPSSISSIKEN